MKYSHLFLRNPLGKKHYVYTNRFVEQPNNEDEEDDKDEDDIRAENNKRMKLINDQQTAVQLIADINNKLMYISCR